MSDINDKLKSLGSMFDGLIKEQAEPSKKEDNETVAPAEVGEEGITPAEPEKLSKLQDIPEDDTDDYEEIADTHIRPSHDDKKDEEEIITYDKDGVPSNYIGDKADYIELGPNPTQKEYLAFRNKYLNMRDENGHRYLFHGVSIEDPDYESFYISMMKIKARNPDEFDRIMAKQ